VNHAGINSPVAPHIAPGTLYTRPNEESGLSLYSTEVQEAMFSLRRIMQRLVDRPLVSTEAGVHTTATAVEHAGLFLNTEVSAGFDKFISGSILAPDRFDLDTQPIFNGKEFFHVDTADLYFGAGGEFYRLLGDDPSYGRLHKQCVRNFGSVLERSLQIDDQGNSVGSIVFVGPARHEMELLSQRLKFLNDCNVGRSKPTVLLCSQCPKELTSVLETSAALSKLSDIQVILGNIHDVGFVPELDRLDAERLMFACNQPSYHFMGGLTSGNLTQKELFKLCENVSGTGRFYFDAQGTEMIYPALCTYNSFIVKKFVSAVPATILSKMGVEDALLRNLERHVHLTLLDSVDEATREYTKTIAFHITLPNSILDVVRSKWEDFPQHMFISRSTRRDADGLIRALTDAGYNPTKYSAGGQNDMGIYGVIVGNPNG